jgi:Protein of unknown function (DUF4065)
MSELKDVLASIAQLYPYPDDLSNARFTKLVYLADWKHCLKYERQITGIEWFFDNYGPFVHDVLKEVKANPAILRLAETTNSHGNKKQLISLANPDYHPMLEHTEHESIEHVVRVTKAMNFQEFVKIVYSTFPIANSSRYSQLDLPALAARYNEQREQTTAPDSL